MINIRKLVCGLGLITAMGACCAGTYMYAQANKLSEAEEEKKELEKEKKELNSTLSDLENDKADILEYIEKYEPDIVIDMYNQKLNLG